MPEERVFDSTTTWPMYRVLVVIDLGCFAFGGKRPAELGVRLGTKEKTGFQSHASSSCEPCRRRTRRDGALGFEHYAVCGHDIGAMVVLALAFAHREAATRVAILDPPMPGSQCGANSLT